jgi:hypothetical protein
MMFAFVIVFGFFNFAHAVNCDKPWYEVKYSHLLSFDNLAALAEQPHWNEMSSQLVGYCIWRDPMRVSLTSDSDIYMEVEGGFREGDFEFANGASRISFTPFLGVIDPSKVQVYKMGKPPSALPDPRCIETPSLRRLLANLRPEFASLTVDVHRDEVVILFATDLLRCRLHKQDLLATTKAWQSARVQIYSNSRLLTQ